jgi:hypothetical protein
MSLRLFSAIPLLAALSSACSFSLEADLPEVQVTQRALKIGGVPGAAQLGDVSVTGSYTLSSCNTASVKRMGSDVLVRQVKIAASDDQTNLDFIEFANVTVADPASPDGTTTIMSYDRSQAASTAVIDVNIPAPIDITALWSADKTVVGLQMAGQLPEQDWTVDVTITLSGKIKYDF